jgi:hypothetical protein
MNEITNHISSMLKISKTLQKKSALIISIDTRHNSKKIRLLPIRQTPYVVCASLASNDIKEIKNVIQTYGHKVNYIFVDAEQKLQKSQNTIFSLKSKIPNTKFFSFKNNDLTAESADLMIDQLFDHKKNLTIAIIGAGNIGSKIGLKLVERGHTVYVTRSKMNSAKKVANAISIFKTKQSTGKIFPVSNSNVGTHCDVLIGASSIAVIDSAMVKKMKKNGMIIDVGLGTIKQSAIKSAHYQNISIIRLDVRPSISGIITSILETNTLLEKSLGSITYNDIKIISGGQYGSYGDVVVDDISSPTVILGIADGNGTLLSKNPKNFESKLDIVKSWIKLKSKLV